MFGEHRHFPGNGRGKRSVEFIIAASTDVGNVKESNQDSLSVKILDTPQGKMVFAILCDGMGGLEKGELASASVIRAFDQWLSESFSPICAAPIDEGALRLGWENVLYSQNQKIRRYGDSHGIKLGTTVVAMLLTQEQYYIINIGDSRAYELYNYCRQITYDHSWVAQEVSKGNMTPEEARHDTRRNILLQCVGASDQIYPDWFTGKILKDTVYMLCSDGFRNEVSADEIFQMLNPSFLLSEENMNQYANSVIDLCKQRQERDNISTVLIRTY